LTSWRDLVKYVIEEETTDAHRKECRGACKGSRRRPNGRRGAANGDCGHVPGTGGIKEKSWRKPGLERCGEDVQSQGAEVRGAVRRARVV